MHINIWMMRIKPEKMISMKYMICWKKNALIFFVKSKYNFGNI